MAPIQKKRKTETAAAPAAATKPAAKSKPTPAPAKDADSYDTAESDSGEENDEYDLASDVASDMASEEEIDSGAESDDSITSLMEAQGLVNKKKRKRNDADAFALTMSKILGSHLTTTARKDPVLVRAKQSQDHVDDGKLEAKAKRIIKEELRKEKEKGRVRDLVPKDDDEAAGRALEKERVLKSIARSGVAKLYNAVRAAQIKGEEAAKGVKKDGVVGMTNRDAKGMCKHFAASRTIANTISSHRDVETGLLGPHQVGQIERVINKTGVFLFSCQKWLSWRNACVLFS